MFQLMDRKAQAKKCDAMEGLLKEGESIIEATEDGTVTRDVGIIMAAQKVEHYEIASYGTLATYAKLLELDEAAALLEDTLAEEKEADETLSELASQINIEAEQEVN